MVEEFLSAERTNRILGASASGPRLVWNKKRGIKIRHCIEAASGPNVFQLPCCFGFFNTFAERQKNEAGVFAKHQKTVYKLIVFTDTISYRFSHWGATRILEAVAMYLADPLGRSSPPETSWSNTCCLFYWNSPRIFSTQKCSLTHGFICFIPSLLLWHM